MAEGGLAFSSDGVLKIGTIETVQKLHIKTVKLGETLANLPNGDLADISCLRILDGQGYDILDSIELQPFEIASSLIVTALTTDTEYYVVGTGFAFPHEDEPVRGRILIFTVVDMRHLQLVHEYEIRGAFSCRARDFVLVADLIKSITLLQFDLTTESLTELAHDHDSNWMAAVEAISDDTFLSADSRSLTLHVADDALTPPATPEILYCTVHGTIGVVHVFASDDTASWRRYRTERRTIDSAGIIDGDLIELFLELERGMQEHVAAEVSRNASITFEALIKMVEDLTRIH
ncbi:hypothetical protein BSLG_003119 [Batrachochytrium salamandrivorans]|nr:hypothetical protein BSLG_003119 [Batrachochytrium salamandrivorans]